MDWCTRLVSRKKWGELYKPIHLRRKEQFGTRKINPNMFEKYVNSLQTLFFESALSQEDLRGAIKMQVH